MYYLLHIPTGKLVYEYYLTSNYFNFGLDNLHKVSKYRYHQFSIYILKGDFEYVSSLLLLMSSKYSTIYNLENKEDSQLTILPYYKYEYEIIELENVE